MRLLYLIILNDPQFISRLRRYHVEKRIPMHRFWLFLSILKDTTTDSEVAPQIIRILLDSGLLSGEEEFWLNLTKR